MATTYNSKRALARGPIAGIGLANQEITVYEEFTPPTLAVNDVFNVFKIPANCIVTFCQLASDDLDANGSPAITLNVGDSGSGTRFYSASTIAQAGGIATAVFPMQKYTVADTIFIKCQAASATYQAGLLKLLVKYVLTDQQVIQGLAA